MATERNWFIAIGDMDGEYAGNPLTFDASQVYGPFTKEQAVAMSAMDDFPHETKAIQAFPAQRISVRELKKIIKKELADAKKDEDEDTDEE